MKLTVTCIPILLACLIAHVASASTIAAGSVSSDIVTIRNRYALSVLPTDHRQIIRVHALGAKYASSLQSNGSWSDINYDDSALPVWPATDHLQRILVMAKSARLYRDSGRPNLMLEGDILRALRWWTRNDYQDHLNHALWWWNQIGVPELLGESANLMWAQLPQKEISDIATIMKRSDWRRGPWAGANLTWGVTIEIARGCIENDPGAVAEGYDTMYQEIKIVGQTQEGIQPDDSFHQHGAQLYSGGYGLAYVNDVGRFIAFAWGTHFQIPADRMAIFSSYLLDGEQWMVWRDIIDYSVVGREITRKGMDVAPSDWTVGPISPAGPAYSLPHVVALLAAEPIPRQQEFQKFATRLLNQTNAVAFTGNKQFWCSDFMAQRRQAFYTSVKMLSNRMQNGELTNGEGKKSEHLSDGVNFLYVTGNEYKDIFPVWDWTKLPGITAIQGTLDTGERNPIGTRGTTTFNGGVSDGTYGMATMDLQRGNLSARKAWFFFDDSFLCLGAGITLIDDAEHDVATDINQALLHGAVFTSQSSRPVADGTQSYQAGHVTWVFHDHVGYILGPGTRANLSIGAQTGKWSDIGDGIGLAPGVSPDQPVTMRVFDLWIDHGYSSRGATYQYVVLPAASLQETMKRAVKPRIQVLSNTVQVQAAWNAQLRLVMVAFREPGILTTPLGRVQVDHSCLLMISPDGHGWRITASDPENKAITLRGTIKESPFTIQLPDGNFAGASATIN
jgi:chondroitin AC lyase